MLSPYVRNHVMRIFDHVHYFNTKPREDLLQAIDNGKIRFLPRSITDYNVYHPKSKVRYLVAKKHFPDAFKGSVADIGDRNGTIKELVDGTVWSTDKNNTALESFDWDVSNLPADDKTFDAVFCLDTLEHVNDLHRSFEDLLRISKLNVIVSLPNCWKKTVKEIVRGRGTRNSYGLPVEKPMDRHRWYMNTEDIEDFFFYNAERLGFDVIDLVYFAPKSAWWHVLYPVFAYVLPERYFKNFVVATVFVHLRRKTA